LTGEEVMAQLPLTHPTKYQYRYPPAAPITIPIPHNIQFLISFSETTASSVI
jgi:hypothetical protein